MKDYSTFGMAALLPGMQHMLDEMQHVLNTFREHLEAAQAPPRGKKRGRPPGKAIVEAVAPVVRKGPASYWDKMTPEERSAEMLRRAAVAVGAASSKHKRSYMRAKIDAKAKTKAKPAKMHPRDPRHPGHEAWKTKLRETQKKAWEGMSKAAQRAMNARRLAGRAKPQVKLVNGAEAVA